MILDYIICMEKSLFYMVKRYKAIALAVKNPLITATVFFIVYCFVGSIWIYLTDWYFDIEIVQTTDSSLYFLKEFSFVLFNGILIFLATLLGFQMLKSGIERVESEITQRNQALKTVELEFADLARKMSHDLRAPIRSVQGFSEALSEDYIDTLDPAALDYLTRIRKSAERMNSLIIDLVEYVKIASTDVRYDSIDVVDFINNQVIKQINDEIPIPLKLKSKGAIPVIYADRSLAQKVFYEILLNAGLFVHKDCKPEVIITGREYEFFCEISITDNGIGVDSKYHESIFAIFTRLHGVEMYPGLGVGLAIAKRSMLRMEGEILLKSDGKSGSQVILRFQKRY